MAVDNGNTLDFFVINSRRLRNAAPDCNVLLLRKEKLPSTKVRVLQELPSTKVRVLQES